MLIRRAVRARLADRLAERAAPLPDELLERPTVVIAPHPDDETLGCGGLIATQRDRGVEVTVVVVTDGAASHGGERSALSAARRAEATEAAAILGVADGAVSFLDAPDGELTDHVDRLVGRIAEVLRERPDALLVVPHPLEPPPDHRAAHHLARAAVELIGRPVDALLYPVWLWDQWPWTNPLSAPRARSSNRQVLRTAVDGRLGLGLERRLTCSLDVAPVLDRKMAALGAHASQTSRPEGRPDHAVLADVAGGEWLDLLLGPLEFYGRTTMGGR